MGERCLPILLGKGGGRDQTPLVVVCMLGRAGKASSVPMLAGRSALSGGGARQTSTCLWEEVSCFPRASQLRGSGRGPPQGP